VNQPEVAEENSMTAAPDAFKYLGKGFDITKYDSFSDTSKAVLHPLMKADDGYLDMTEKTNTVQTKYAKTVHDRYRDHHGWMFKLEAMDFSGVVQVEFQANWDKTLILEKYVEYNVDELHTDTAKIDMDKVKRETQKLADTGSLLFLLPKFYNRILDFPENVLYKELRDILRYSAPRSEEIKLNVCKELLESEKVSGATHFISGVRLGARVTQLFLKEKAQTAKEKAVSSKVAAEGVGMGVSFDSQQMKKFELTRKYIFMQKGSDIELIDNVSLPSTIPREKAVAIGLELLPITDLVPLEWRDPLKRVCIDRLKKELMKKPALPGKDANVSYFLKAGNFWLKADISRIVATEKLEEASHFYVIPNSESPASFYIEYRTPDNILWYVFVGSNENDDVKLS
jgi:hypothetical protein